MTIKSKQVFLPILALFIFAAISAFFMVNKKEQEKKPPKNNTAFVSTQLIHKKPYQYHIVSQGLVQPRYKTTVVAQASGEVVEVSDSLSKGGFIKKGAVLAKIDPFNYQVKLQQAKASLASARAAFILERAQGQVAEAEWAQISQAKPSELGLRKPQQEQALAAVKAAEAGLTQAQKDLDRTTILAPYDGIIENRIVSPGSFVSMGSPVAQIMSTKAAEIRLPINQIDFAYLDNQGVSAPVQLSAIVDGATQRWNAHITRTEGVIDSETRMLYLVATVRDPYRLKDPISANTPLVFGTFASARIMGVKLGQAVLIPRRIIRDGQVPVAKNGQLLFKKITVGRHEGKNSVVTQGLDEGDRLITSALDHPSPGMSIDWEGKISSNTDNNHATHSGDE